MTAGDLHARIAAIALRAASRHGFALGGGNALIAHGVTSRPTQDVDLFTNQEDGVAAATPAVEGALTAAGYTLQREDQAGGLADIFPDMGEGLAEWTVTSPSGEQTVLQLAYFDRTREPVTTATGPLLALEDVIAGKVCALASRVEPRDYVDTARLLDRYTPGQLIALARRLDPGLTSRDFADVATQLASIADTSFARYGLSPREITALRERFAGWPATAQAVRQAVAAAEPAVHQPEQAQPDTPDAEREIPLPERDDPEAGG